MSHSIKREYEMRYAIDIMTVAATVAALWAASIFLDAVGMGI